MKVSQREKEVINLIAQELTTKEIAAQLYISNSTVTSHRKNAMEKLKAKNTAGLISKSFRHGILTILTISFLLSAFCTNHLIGQYDVGIEMHRDYSTVLGVGFDEIGPQLLWIPEESVFLAGSSSNNNGSSTWATDSIGSHASGFGRANKPFGFGSMVWGESNEIYDGSIWSTAFGNDNTIVAGCEYCTIWGENNSTANRFSTAFGTFNQALGDHATVWGEDNEGTGSHSTIWGKDNIASGTYSTAFGLRTHANGPGSISAGLDTRAGGNYSTALGVGNVAKGFSSLVAGRYCDTIIADDQFLFDDTTPIFVLGNGTTNNSRSNAMSVFGNGRMKLGKGTATSDLHIKQSETTPNTGSGGILLEHTNNDSYWQIHYSGNNLSFTKDGTRRAYITPDGELIDDFNPPAQRVTKNNEDLRKSLEQVIIGKTINPKKLSRVVLDESKFVISNPSMIIYDESNIPIGIDYKQLYLTAIAALQEEIKVNRKQQELIDHIIGHLNLTK